MTGVMEPRRKGNRRNNTGVENKMGKCDAWCEGVLPAAAHMQPGRGVCTSTLEVPAMGSNALLHPVGQGSNGGTGIKALQQPDS